MKLIPQGALFFRYTALWSAGVLAAIVFPQTVQAAPLFDDFGKPMPEFKTMLQQRGFPELLEGVDFYPLTKKGSKWRRLDTHACVTFKFEINPEGRLSRYAILDSDPEGVWETAIAAAMATWKFQPTDKYYSGVIPSVFFADDTPLKPGDTVTGLGGKGGPHCLTPKTIVSYSIPQEVESAGYVGWIVPPRDAVRAQISGCTTLAFRILPDGSTADFEALDSSPAGTFDVASAVSVGKWQFTAHESAKPLHGFVNFKYGYAEFPEQSHRECLDPEQARQRYSPTETTPP